MVAFHAVAAQVHDTRVGAADATAPGDHVTTAGYSPNAVRVRHTVARGTSQQPPCSTPCIRLPRHDLALTRCGRAEAHESRLAGVQGTMVCCRCHRVPSGLAHDPCTDPDLCNTSPGSLMRGSPGRPRCADLSPDHPLGQDVKAGAKVDEIEHKEAAKDHGAGFVARGEGGGGPRQGRCQRQAAQQAARGLRRGARACAAGCAGSFWTHLACVLKLQVAFGDTLLSKQQRASPVLPVQLSCTLGLQLHGH